MRLDHLLSTEISGHGSCVRCVPHGFRWSVCRVVAGVEEISGFRAGFSSGEWYGYAFGLPDRHPMVFLALWRGSMPVMDGPVVVGTSGGSGGAWWFENWIVDASKRNSLLFSFCLSRFRQASFLEAWFRDRSFCDHFYSVMICRLANLAINGPHGGPVRIPGRVVVKGVWWMPWQTVPMKDV